MDSKANWAWSIAMSKSVHTSSFDIVTQLLVWVLHLNDCLVLDILATAKATKSTENKFPLYEIGVFTADNLESFIDWVIMKDIIVSRDESSLTVVKLSLLCRTKFGWLILPLCDFYVATGKGGCWV
jgi:hypothetical protein